ncbi:MAG: hypothetical protein ABR508_08670 [Candidatus Baltobacteraceae bacterium]
MKTVHALRLALLFAFIAGSAACSGGGGQAALPQTSKPTTGEGLYSSSGTALTVTGKVVGFMSGGFEMQGGSGFGYFNVYTTSSTVFIGAKPFLGEQIAATGTGSVTTSMTATQVAQGAVLGFTAPIVALISGGFEVHGPPGVGYLNVWTNAGTRVTGPQPFVGETVTVAGTGSYSTSLTALTVAQSGGSTASPSASPSGLPSGSPAPAASATAKPVSTTAPSPAPRPTPTATPAIVSQTGLTQPVQSAFMPSSWGKISAMQVFDDTADGYITQAAAAANGNRYSAVWGARNNIGTAWLTSNPGLQTAYYNALETDESPTGWGAIGHTLTWWQSVHPDWVLYACTASGSVSANPAWVPGLNNVPLDVHNPAVVDYQVRLMANYAHQLGYHALAIDEATFWQSDAGAGSGSYGCGIHQNGSFVRRYTGVMDANWAADVVAWVKQAHALLTTDPVLAPYRLKLIVNHPATTLTTQEQAFLSNVDAVLNEDGFSFYGNYIKGSASYFTRAVNWATYAQQHGVAVLTNDNWGSLNVGTPQIEWSVATYLMGNEQAESLFAANSKGYGVENWHSQYTANTGAPCGEYYSARDSSNPSIYYRRFANALVVVNGGSGSNSEVAHLPTGHVYTDLFGRAVSNPLTIGSNDGYVLMTSNGCN